MAGTRNQIEEAPLYRAARAIALGASDVNAMSAMDTGTLVDRVECFCLDTQAFYQYQQDSVLAADGVNTIAPLDGGPGRWILLQAIANGGAGELDILGTKRSGTDQVGVGLNSDIILNNLIFVRGAATYDFNTGIYTLIPLKVYELDAGGLITTFSDATGGILQISWVDAITNLAISSDVPGIWKPTTNTVASSTPDRAHALFVPADDTEAQIKLRVLAATGTADISQNFGAVVKQLR